MTVEEAIIFANKFLDRELKVLEDTANRQGTHTKVISVLEQVTLVLTSVLVPSAGMVLVSGERERPITESKVLMLIQHCGFDHVIKDAFQLISLKPRPNLEKRRR